MTMTGNPGRWKPGESGNPKGRLPGTKIKRTLLGEQLEQAGSQVQAVVITKALDGDMQAASLVMTRISPPLRPRAEKVEFALDPDAPMAQQAKQIMLAVSKAQIDPDTGKLLIDCLSAYVGLKDIETFLAELRKLRGTQSPIAGGVMTT